MSDDTQDPRDVADILGLQDARDDSEPRELHDFTTCGTCGFSWDDSIITSVTPVPSGRTPCEYFHDYDDDGEYVGLDREAIATDRDLIAQINGLWPSGEQRDPPSWRDRYDTREEWEESR
jgi:hypothetical protein